MDNDRLQVRLKRLQRVKEEIEDEGNSVPPELVEEIERVLFAMSEATVQKKQARS